jgi:hypothetical protein
MDGRINTFMYSNVRLGNVSLQTLSGFYHFRFEIKEKCFLIEDYSQLKMLKNVISCIALIFLSILATNLV